MASEESPLHCELPQSFAAEHRILVVSSKEHHSSSREKLPESLPNRVAEAGHPTISTGKQRLAAPAGLETGTTVYLPLLGRRSGNSTLNVVLPGSESTDRFPP